MTSPQFFKEVSAAYRCLVYITLLGSAALSYPPELIGIFGWDGDRHAALAEPDGSFRLRDNGDRTISFDIFNDPSSLKWYNHSGYLPCLVTEFDRDNATVKIMNFTDKVAIGAGEFLIAYSRVSIANHGSTALALSPGAHNTVALNNPSTTVPAGQTVAFDYAVTQEIFNNANAYPSDSELRNAGTWDEHFAHMQSYWDSKLAEIALIGTPDEQLNNAYKAGFIYINIVKDLVRGMPRLHVGENGYNTVYDHDAVGIAAALLSMGYLSDAKDILRYVPGGSVPNSGMAKTHKIMYSDDVWKHNWLYALYLLKTGDEAHVRQQWDALKSTGRFIATERTGPGGIMLETRDIDSYGYWVLDNYSALFGLACYMSNAHKLGETAEYEWARAEHRDLLDSCNAAIAKLQTGYGIDYLPCSMLQPNDSNRCSRADDANWAAPFFFGRWGWDGWLAGAEQYGPFFDLIDPTYTYGFERLRQTGRPEGTFGGYPGYCSAYNAGYGGAALRGKMHRTAGIRAYQFMIDGAQSGPFCWWENISDPAPTAWEGTHPSGGGGSCPHMWGQSACSKVLLESIIAEFYDGRVLIGRGVPDEWLGAGVQVANYPISGGNRMDAAIKAVDTKSIKLTVSGDRPAGNVLFSLPAFIDNIASASSGTFDNNDGTVTVDPSQTSVTVTLTNALDKSTLLRFGSADPKTPEIPSFSHNRLRIPLPDYCINKRARVELLDMRGRCVFSATSPADRGQHVLQIPCRVAAGIYHVRISAGNKRTIRSALVP
ncbi:MAG: hypothetical protein GF350_05400 [Chitinivibrionales bacterium]|nr:hypothetical protein [Chitinivibrionales bacterium]